MAQHSVDAVRIIDWTPFSQTGSLQNIDKLLGCDLSIGSDPDGDGYGWQNGESCTVAASQQEQAVLDFCYPITGSNGDPTYCLDNDEGTDLLPDLVDCEDPDGDGWVGMIPTVLAPARLRKI